MPHIVQLPLSKAKPLIEEADVLLFRGESLASYFLGRAAKSQYTHIALASWHNGSRSPQALLECVEFKEWVGGRAVNLETVVRESPCLIDVYRHSPRIWRTYYDNNKVFYSKIDFVGKPVTNTMRIMTGLPYGWERIWLIAQRKLAFLRLLYSMEDSVSDSLEDVIYPVCSTAVAYSFSKHGYDLVKNRADEWTEPGDIARSPSLNYLFTLCP